MKTRHSCLIFLFSLTLLLPPPISSCVPANCDVGERCRGSCYTRKNKEWCSGQCVGLDKNTTDSYGCADLYKKCFMWDHLCSNPVVAKACRKTCNYCLGGPVADDCRGLMCDGVCVPLTYLCDGVSDCRDNNDERNCNYLTDTWFYPNRSRRCGIRSNYNAIVNIKYSKSKKTLELRRIHRTGGGGRAKRLVNSKFSASYAWPWTGIILSDNNVHLAGEQLDNRTHTFCGATLIHEDWAITAAHCITVDGNIKKSDFKITFGKHYTRTTLAEKKTNQIRNVSKILYFRNYDENDIHNDIALLKLNESVVLNEYVNIVCMPIQHDIQQFYKIGGVATGWGYDERGKISSRLKQTLVKPMDRGRCSREIYRIPYISIDASLLCTEIDHENGFGVTCDGDSGGPMVVRRKTGSFALLGITSFGTDKNCSKPGEAAVFTSVYYYLPWIRHFVELTFI